MFKVEEAILLADDLVPDLLSGDKTVTIRKGKRIFAPEITIAGHPALVKAVQYTTLAEVELEVLLADGFESVENAVEGMKRFYPDITEDTDITVIYFELKG